MVDDAMIKVLDDASERLLRCRYKWAEFMAESALAGGAHTNALDDATREAFATFHDRPAYTADGEALSAGPTLVVTGVPSDTDEYVSKACAKINMDVRMCEYCHKVARRMGFCKSCNHATYCSGACQTAAWKAHKPLCRELNEHGDRLGALGRTGGKCLFYPPPFFRETLRPDRPHLCKFWLEALVASLSNVACLDAYLPLAGIVAYLWKYTWAAFPGFLRQKFVTNLRPLHARLAREERKDAARMSDAQRAEQRQCRYFLLMCDGVSWMAKGDRELAVWLRGGGLARQLPRWEYHDSLVATEHARTYRYVLAECMERQHDTAGFPQQHEDIPWDTGCVLLCIVPRGRGLIASAYGQTHAPEVVTSILTAWAAARDTPDGWREMREEVLQLFGVGAFAKGGTAPGGPRDPRYVSIRQPPEGALGRPLGDWRAIAEVLTLLQGIGARAAPVYIADVIHVETRDCLAHTKRVIAQESEEAGRAIMAEARATLERLGPVTHGIEEKLPSHPREIKVADVVLPRR